MRIVRFALGTMIAFFSCRSSKTVTAVAPQIQQQVQVNAIQADAPQPKTALLQRESATKNTEQPAMLGLTSNNNLQETKADIAIQPQIETENTKDDFTEMSASFENKQSENIQSFAQVKQMAANKQLNLTSKQLKRLDKLDNKYHGDFNKFKKDAGNIFDTQTSKIIAAVGVVGLLLLIISSSGFGAFLLILSVGALLLKWLGIISF